MGIKKDFMPIYQKEKAYEDQLRADLNLLVGKSESVVRTDNPRQYPMPSFQFPMLKYRLRFRAVSCISWAPSP